MSIAKVGTLVRDEDGLIGLQPDEPGGYIKHYGECGKGWTELLLELDATLSIVSPQTSYTQIKEKFGNLRVYTTGLSTDGVNALRQAEKKAEEICELCGEPGELRENRAWVLTLCDLCDTGRETRLPH